MYQLTLVPDIRRVNPHATEEEKISRRTRTRNLKRLKLARYIPTPEVPYKVG
jgi:hypothetical protein